MRSARSVSGIVGTRKLPKLAAAAGGVRDRGKVLRVRVGHAIPGSVQASDDEDLAAAVDKVH